MLGPKSRSVAIACSAVTLFLTSAAVLADPHSPGTPQWGPGQLVLMGAGCPIETPDALSLMVASGRPGGSGMIDIWVMDRPAVGAQWSAPKNLPTPVNSPTDDFCPAPFERSLFFISVQGSPPGCGGGDIYLSRQSPAGDWSDPVHLPCAPDGPNTAGTERSPSLIETRFGTFLFYSTNGGVAGADDDIYVSFMNDKGEFGRGHVVQALSTRGYQDQMPTVRAVNGAFEITFNSDRPGTRWEPVSGGQDVYFSRTRFLPFWWPKPRNAGPNVNTTLNETRASLSYDGSRLYVGRTDPEIGRTDVYVSERDE